VWNSSGIQSCTGQRPVEHGRHDANHSARPAIHDDRALENRWIAAESLLPQSIGDDDDVVSAAFFFRGAKTRPRIGATPSVEK
jgi:hypothetical protein